MIGEISVLGIYMSPLLVWALLALCLYLPARWLLRRSGFYRLVWHRALFDMALYVILWSGLAAFSPSLIALANP
ncbi:MAG TPA: DUF1656 domain-containing protein [Pedomonas sp.]|uniref:DUF1656 domain-containing protein n=1 Tax=Pedomonas sp. TaxID=2976421 RepID=UPI002F410087